MTPLEVGKNVESTRPCHGVSPHDRIETTDQSAGPSDLDLFSPPCQRTRFKTSFLHYCIATLVRPKSDKPQMATYSFRLPADLAAELERLRWELRRSKGSIVAEALRAHLPVISRKAKKGAR
jgi:hypothetical protein